MRPVPDYDPARFRICNGPCGILQPIYNFVDFDTRTVNDLCWSCVTAAKATIRSIEDLDYLTNEQLFSVGIEFWQVAMRAALMCRR